MISGLLGFLMRVWVASIRLEILRRKSMRSHLSSLSRSP